MMWYIRSLLEDRKENKPQHPRNEKQNTHPGHLGHLGVLFQKKKHQTTDRMVLINILKGKTTVDGRNPAPPVMYKTL